MTSLNILFNPKTVAVIGASANPTKWGNWLVQHLLTGKKRNLYLVNSQESHILDVKCVPTVQDIPEFVDVAFLCVPQEHFEGYVDQLLARGTRFIVGITAGFSERDNKGFQAERRIVEKCHRTGIGTTFIGPNCAGVWDGYTEFHCLPVADFTPGPVGLISQSGGMISDLYYRLHELGLGYSRVISTGNQADIHIADLVKNYDQDPNTQVIALYIENEQDIPYHVFETTSKPIVLLTPDTSPATRRAAKNHTNSTPSATYHVAEATTENGALHATTVSEFVAFIQVALSGLKAVTSKRTVIVTDSGGFGVLAASRIENRSMLSLLEPSPQLKQHIKEKMRLPQATLDNPIDLINVPGGFSDQTLRLMRVLQTSPEVDAILCILFLVETDKDPEKDRQCGLQIAECIEKPTVFVCKNFTFAGTRALLEQQIPVYKDVEIAVAALEAMCG